MRRAGWLSVAVLLASLAGCARVSDLGHAISARAQAALHRPETDIVPIPQRDAYGGQYGLEARICRPGGPGPFPILLINHGEPHNISHDDVRPPACASPAASWFVARGWLLVLPLRRDYGRSGGEWAENPGPCASPDPERAARAGAHDIAAAAAFAQALPGARPDGLVVLGWDTGGLAALAFAGQSPPGTRIIAMAAAGGAASQAGHVCRPDLLVDALGRLGVGSHAPSLWVYARDDDLIPPELAEAMAHAFRAGGGEVTLAQPETATPHGHDLFFAAAGPAVWGPLIESFLAR